MGALVLEEAVMIFRGNGGQKQSMQYRWREGGELWGMWRVRLRRVMMLLVCMQMLV
jgi:hypothetical protein